MSLPPFVFVIRLVYHTLYQTYLFTWAPSSVFSRIMFLSMSPLDICNMSNDRTIRSDTVPFPEPGAPMISACSLFITTIFLFCFRIVKIQGFRIFYPMRICRYLTNLLHWQCSCFLLQHLSTRKKLCYLNDISITCCVFALQKNVYRTISC